MRTWKDVVEIVQLKVSRKKRCKQQTLPLMEHQGSENISLCDTKLEEEEAFSGIDNKFQIYEDTENDEDSFTVYNKVYNCNEMLSEVESNLEIVKEMETNGENIIRKLNEGENNMQSLLEEMDKEHNNNKWEGFLEMEIDGSAENVWEFAKKFGDIREWYPLLNVCKIVEGEEGKVGCVRYCEGTFWAKEKLLSFDEKSMSYSYCVIDGSLPGLDSLVVTFAVSNCLTDPCNKSTLSWHFSMDPSPLFSSHDQFLTMFEACYSLMAKGLEFLVFDYAISSS